ncbi:MAG: zinc ribbon domain-containing protein [Lachnospiraceae bacterium]|nr:zinc ribbon domain-containing protein [Lachnospiraceae bacterium]
MICNHCGAEIPDGSAFCNVCGGKIGNIQSEIQAVSQQEDLPGADAVLSESSGSEDIRTGGIDTDTQEKDEKLIDIMQTGKGRRGAGRSRRNRGSEEASERERKPFKPGPVVYIAAALVLVLCVIIGLLSKTGGGSQAGEREDIALKACIDDDGTAFLPLMNGKHVKIDDVIAARITPDRKRVVVLDKADELYVTDSSLKNKKVIEEELEYGGLSFVDDHCVLYVKDNQSYIYRYGDEEPISLGDGVIDGYDYSLKGGNLIYTMNSNVYLLTRTFTEREKIGSFETGCRILYISDDGKKAYWAQENPDESNKYDIYTLKDGEREKLCSYSSPYYPDIIFNRDKTYGILGSTHAESFYVIDSKGNATKVGMGNPLIFYTSSVFTADGYLSDDTSSSFKGAYMIVDGSDEPAEFNLSYEKFNLYYIDEKGERERIMTDLQDIRIQNGLLYYMSDDELRCARLDKGNVKKDETLARDVDLILMARGDYIYYVTESYTSGNDNHYGTIYVSIKGGEPVKVCDEAFLDDYYSSADGKVLYYFRDPDNDPDNAYTSATFCKYDSTKKKSDKISDSVCLGRIYDGKIRSGSDSLTLDDTFVYFKQVDDDDIHWMYYDSKDSSEMIDGLESGNLP